MGISQLPRFLSLLLFMVVFQFEFLFRKEPANNPPNQAKSNYRGVLSRYKCIRQAQNNPTNAPFTHVRALVIPC